MTPVPKRSHDMHGMPRKIGRVIASSGPLTSTSMDLPNSPPLDIPPNSRTLRRTLPRMQSTTESYTSTRRPRSKHANLRASAAPTNPRIISCRGRTGCLFALQISLQGISRASGVRGTAVARSCHVLVGYPGGPNSLLRFQHYAPSRCSLFRLTLPYSWIRRKWVHADLYWACQALNSAKLRTAA